MDEELQRDPTEHLPGLLRPMPRIQHIEIFISLGFPNF